MNTKNAVYFIIFNINTFLIYVFCDYYSDY